MEPETHGELLADVGSASTKALALLVLMLEESGAIPKGDYRNRLTNLINDPEADPLQDRTLDPEGDHYPPRSSGWTINVIGPASRPHSPQHIRESGSLP
jgi:hypothetical protein